jgi:hypothetical protein
MTVLGQSPATPKTTSLPLTPSAAPLPALKYRLLPAVPDLTQGNAAPGWLRAFSALAESRLPLAQKHYDWESYEAPADAVPLADVRRLLSVAEVALALSESAARRDHCAWGDEPLTLRSPPYLMPHPQRFRELSAVLGLRFRLALAERRYAEAARALQTELALARHTAEGGRLIDTLIGMSIAASVLRHVEEWTTTPDSPNLYWALSAVAHPFPGLRKSYENEFGVLYRTFPELRDLAQARRTPEEMRRLSEELLRLLPDISEASPKHGWSDKFNLTLRAATTYPEAKRYLLDHGRTAAQVEAMPVLQVVLIYVTEEFDRWRDDTLKWVELPYQQSGAGLQRMCARLQELGPAQQFLPITRLVPLPNMERIAGGMARLERTVAGLRCVEAVRLYAAAHDGKVPSALEEIKEVPIPLDPMTGRPFRYSLREGRAVVEAPPPAADLAVSAESGLRYELTIRR